MRVRVYPNTLAKITGIATARVEGHMARGSKSGSPDKQKRVLMEVRATICEWAFSMLHPSLRNSFNEDVSLKGDGGYDYQLSNLCRVDIKSGPPQAEAMIVGDKCLNKADVFVMTRYLERERVVEFIGWCKAGEVKSLGTPGDLKMWRGQPHTRIELAKLRPMETLEIV